ncbi:exported hypothetical protein [Syntrophobacter sp. SbD1]|nr:exported hypothetical protein [Syntrophobacter sp. SbD1]
MSKRIQSLAVLAFIGIFALVFATPGFSQTSGVSLGIKGSNPSGDLSKNAVPATPTKDKSSSGVPLGIKGSNPSGDLSTNAVPATVTKDPASSANVKTGIKGSNPSGDLTTTTTGSGK